MRRATALAVPVRTLALSSYISSHFVAVHSSSVHCSRKSQKTLMMLKIFYAGSLGLSPAILAQFTFTMCVAARNRKKLRKPLILGFKVVQNHRSRYPTPTPQKKLVTSACYDKQHVCAYLQLFYARRVNGNKITTSRETSLFDARVRRLS